MGGDLMNPKLNSAWWALRIGLGLAAFLAGLDKFFNVLADWGTYLSPMLERLLPVSRDVFLGFVGVVEMTVGLLVLSGFARVGGYVVMAWLVGIAASLVTTGRFFDIAVRDVEMAIAAYTLARLTEVRDETMATSEHARRAGAGWRLWTPRRPLVNGLDLEDRENARS
jgi:uncharacterized membrane protein YphA (DoxX/SURF4 family)